MLLEFNEKENKNVKSSRSRLQESGPTFDIEIAIDCFRNIISWIAKFAFKLL